MFVDAEADGSGANYRFFLEEKMTWPAEKAELLKAAERTNTEYLKTLKDKTEIKEAEAAQQEATAALQKADSYVAHQWGWSLLRLRKQTGTVPEDVQARFDR